MRHTILKKPKRKQILVYKPEDDKSEGYLGKTAGRIAEGRYGKKRVMGAFLIFRRTMKRFKIQGEWDDNDKDFLYWSNDLGWVDFASASIFQDDEIPFINLPIGAKGRKKVLA